MAQESRLSLVVDSRQAKPRVEEVAKVMRLLGDAQGAWNLYIRIWRPDLVTGKCTCLSKT